MTRRTVYSLLAGLFLVALAAGWVVFAPATGLVQGGHARATNDGGSGILDGMTFSGVMGRDKGAEVPDTFVFASGTFMSTECDRRCGYPARPYYVRQLGEAVEFVSESQCQYKDAKIVWRGTVDGNRIKGVSTWTVNRWYWTIEKDIPFEGALVRSAPSVISNP